MIGSRVLGLQMVFTNYPLIYVLLKYFRLWYYTHWSHRIGLLKNLIRRTLEPRPFPRRILACYPSCQALVQAPLLGRFGQHRSQLAFRTLESGDLVHAIIADFSTSIEGHHRYPSGEYHPRSSQTKHRPGLFILSHVPFLFWSFISNLFIRGANTVHSRCIRANWDFISNALFCYKSYCIVHM